jgi:hypothetical protein
VDKVDVFEYPRASTNDTGGLGQDKWSHGYCGEWRTHAWHASMRGGGGRPILLDAIIYVHARSYI